ncbi:MAG TPA: LamG domain-containing protein, partial [Chitinophagaceae bacterium]|nr:LamG domain-containing protein [Chitinophagaceae bacterium]
MFTLLIVGSHSFEAQSQAFNYSTPAASNIQIMGAGYSGSNAPSNGSYYAPFYYHTGTLYGHPTWETNHALGQFKIYFNLVQNVWILEYLFGGFLPVDLYKVAPYPPGGLDVPPPTGWTSVLPSYNPAPTSVATLYKSYFTDADGDKWAPHNSTTSIFSEATFTPPGYVFIDDVLGYNDCDDNNSNSQVPYTFYIDNDHDGFGSGATANTCALNASSPPVGFSMNSSDCDDNNANAHYFFNVFADNDYDGFGAGSQLYLCLDLNNMYGYSFDNSDCNDNNASVHASYSFYTDNDHDGYGTGNIISLCAASSTTAPSGYSINNSDCDDNNNSIHQQYTFYVDDDQDGYGLAGSNSVQLCAANALQAPTGFSVNALDCDDNFFNANAPNACAGFSLSGQNNVLHFDGIDDYIKRPTAIQGNSGTWEAWVQKSNWNSSIEEILFGNGNYNSMPNAFYIGLYPNVGFFIRYGGANQLGNTYVTSSSTLSFTSNSWHHLAATWNHVSGTTTLKIYVDGALVNSTTCNLNLNLSTPSYIGGDIISPKFGPGSLDEIRVWNYARSAAQIASSYNTPIANVQTGLAAYHNFNVGVAGGNNLAFAHLPDVVTPVNVDTLYNFTLNGASSNFINTSTPITTKIYPQNNILHFDGVDDYIEQSTFINGTSGTWEAWVQKDNWNSSSEEILCSNGSYNPASNAFYIGLYPNVGFFIRYGGTNKSGNTYISSNVSLGFTAHSWHHLSATWQHQNGVTTLIIYIDGVAVGQTSTNLLLNNSSTHTHIGGVGSTFNFGPGSLDEIRMWNYARSATEIATANTITTPYPQLGLISLMDLNAGNAAGNNTNLTSLPDLITPSTIHVLHNFLLLGPSSNFIASPPTGLSQVNACAGQTLSIYGTGFAGALPANVTIGNIPVLSILSNTGEEMVVTLPNVAVTGFVTVANANGTGVSSTPFTVSSVTASASSSSVCQGSSITLTGAGANSYSWSGGVIDGVAFFPSSTTTYTVTGVAASGCTSTATQVIIVTPCLINVQVSAFLQGYYLTSSLMNGVLFNQGVGGATMTDVDSVTIELHQSSAPYNVLYSFTGKLQTNGMINASFPNEVMGQSYYIIIKHRNSIETWSTSSITLQGNTYYDFSTAATQAYGNNQIEVEPGIFALYSGDINQDGF